MLPTEFSISIEGRSQPWTNGFERVENLGSGGMVIVYAVRNKRTGRIGVVKQAKSPDKNTGVSIEADTINRIEKAPGFPELYDWGTDGRIYWIATSRLKGQHFTETNLPELPNNTKLEILLSFADRIKTAWDHGVLLTDYKADNFLYDVRDGVGLYDLNTTRRLPKAEQSLPQFAKVIKGQVERMATLNPPFSEVEISHILKGYQLLMAYRVKYNDKPNFLYNEGSMARENVVKAMKKGKWENLLTDAAGELSMVLNCPGCTEAQVVQLTQGESLSTEKREVAEVLLTLLRKSDRNVYTSKSGVTKREESVKRLIASIGNPVLLEIYSGTAKKIMTDLMSKFAKSVYPDIEKIHDFFSQSKSSLRRQHNDIPPAIETLIKDLDSWIKLSEDDRGANFTGLRQKLVVAESEMTRWEDQQRKSVDHKIDEAKFKDFLVFVHEIVSTALTGKRQPLEESRIIQQFRPDFLLNFMEKLPILKGWVSISLKDAQMASQRGENVSAELLGSFKNMVATELELLNSTS